MSPVPIPSQAKWAYMQEVGRTRYLVTRTLFALAILFVSCVLGGFFAGATVHSVSWSGLAVAMLVLAPFVFLHLQAYWNQCENSEVLRRPTVHTPRFEGDFPHVGREGLPHN